jgi:hypothetical protein
MPRNANDRGTLQLLGRLDQVPPAKPDPGPEGPASPGEPGVVARVRDSPSVRRSLPALRRGVTRRPHSSAHPRGLSSGIRSSCKDRPRRNAHGQPSTSALHGASVIVPSSSDGAAPSPPYVAALLCQRMRGSRGRPSPPAPLRSAVGPPPSPSLRAAGPGPLTRRERGDPVGAVWRCSPSPAAAGEGVGG